VGWIIIETLTGAATFAGDGGFATAASINTPQGIAVDSAGNLFIADSSNYRIREVVTATGKIQTVAGTGVSGTTGNGGLATSAPIIVLGLVVDPSGNIFFSSKISFFTTTYAAVREVFASTGIIQTVLGAPNPGYSGDGGPGSLAGFNYPYYLALDSTGALFVSDRYNNVIRRAK
jgi:hypothetical protein